LTINSDNHADSFDEQAGDEQAGDQQTGSPKAQALSRDAMPSNILIGLDVGSTTVKAVVMDPETDEILWKDYKRHETRQPEMVNEFIKDIQETFPLPQENLRIFITGSGGNMLREFIGAKFVQEVNAVSLAVEHLYPEAGSVIELGGQDAKIIIWFTDQETGTKRKVPSMNDKCAGGTGAVIDKINAKLQLTGEQLQALEYYDVKLHPVAGKCGVFAETDINGLQKQGVPSDQLMASLFEAIIQQNLSVLTRGNTLRPTVLLLGGPNTYIPAMRDCWKNNIPKIWAERNTPLPEGVPPEDLIIVPENAQYYAAIGSVLYGKNEDAHIGVFKGTTELEEFIEVGRVKMREQSGDIGLAKTDEELDEFKKLFAKSTWEPTVFAPGQEVEGFIGIDGGSTSTKAVLMDRDGVLLAKSYQLSKGNPLADAQDILTELRENVENQGATLKVLGVATTGYAKDMLKETLDADVAIVETVAHTKSAIHYYDDVDVIVDVGGQDIKVIVLNDGKVKDFKLNTQCSAGNGYFLQSTAAKFGYSVAEFADVAFDAERLPVFGYGCAVFMETDIVNFQQLGWEKKEIMAGLAKVLPKNIWLYVVAEPNLSKFGTNFVLQGGTQHNLAAVKSQYDFIMSKVPNAKIRVHEFTGESGAIGAALEAIRVAAERDSSFIGLKSAENLEFTTTRDESTRCNFCKNNCLRTYIDTETPQGDNRRFIIATCEKGTVESMDDMKEIKARLDAIMKANPNFVEKASVRAFRTTNAAKVSSLRKIEEETVEEPQQNKGFLSRFRKQQPAQEATDVPKAEPISQEVRVLRRDIKIGIPRVLNMYSLAPFFQTYFESVGVGAQNIIYSDYTDPTMWYKGSRRGSIDQCFPSKVAIAHVHNLIFDQKDKNKPDVIFYPIINKLISELANIEDSAACPTVAISPEVVKAAFTKEGNVFAENDIRYVSPSFDPTDWPMFEYEIWKCMEDLLQVTWEENKEALDIAYKAWREYFTSLRVEGREVLDKLEEEGRLGVVMLARPYHNDPGLNHEIMEEIQKKGYPIFSIDSLPQDEDILDRLFGKEVEAGVITHPMDITDVWKNAYSENSSKKIWAAKYVARHPNLVAIDLSSFKCGHDAPNYNTIEKIIEASNTPYFTFFDIDESKPSGSIKIRVETIDYFLQRYQEHLQRKVNAENELQYMVETYKKGLLRANAKAADNLELAGHINISGNDSRPSGHKGAASDGLQSEGHGHDSWVPVTLDLGAKVSAQNGNGNSSSPAVAAANSFNENVMRVNGDNAKALGGINTTDYSAYDKIRQANTADDVVEEEFGSGSASCGIPTRDYPLKAYASDGEAIVGLEDDGETPEGQFIKLGNFVVPLNQKDEETVEEKTPVEAD
jgi:predicted CoA-substrate-specific enzyme activase